MNFTLSGKGGSEINDERLSQIFPIEGYQYQIRIRPHSSFWRFGLRFSADSRGAGGYSKTHRYNNPQVKHLEVCVGVRNPDWQMPNVIHLQEYYITEKGSTYFASQDYVENGDVILSLTPRAAGFMDVSLSSGSIHHERTVNLVFSKAFEVFGWADFLDFSLNGEIAATLMPLSIDLKPIKALTNQVTKVNIHKLAVFFGTNNSGKTSVLMGIINSFFDQLNNSIDYLGLNRVYTESSYNFKLESAHEQIRFRTQRENRRTRVDTGSNQNARFDWIDELALQDEDTRQKILEWISQHFEPWSFIDLQEGRYTTGVRALVNNLEPNEQGSGARAIMPIIIQLYNPHVTLLAIDEPELALEPGIQKMLLTAIHDAVEGKNGFPLKRVLIATHSHLFLDRITVANNFHVSKVDGQVLIEPVQNITKLQDFTYRMLGASPSDLFFPGNIIVVEGKSDHIFLEGLYKLGLQQGLFKNNLAFHYMEGFDKLSYSPDAIVQMLKTQSYVLVYFDKICGLFDRPSDSKLMTSVRSHFGDQEAVRFVTLDKHAIEYYYPLDAINRVFKTNIDQGTYHDVVTNFLKTLSSKSPYAGTILGRELTKVELASLIVNALTQKDLEQVETRIIDLLRKADMLAFR